LSSLITKVMRSGHVESFHVGFGIVCEPDGKIIQHFGEETYPTYVRSSAKPLQAAAVIRSGAADHFKLTDAELAVICSSHNAEPVHVQSIRSILDKIEVDESAFDCGAHPPIDRESAAGLIRQGTEPTAVHNNCSGKHSGMLAVAQHLGAGPADYINPEHPAQKLIHDIVCEYTDEEQVFRGLDGCSAPVFFLPIQKLALAFARIAQQDTEEKKRIFRVMNENPYLVAGRKRFDTDLMTQFPDILISKGGGEAILGLGINTGDRVLGIALKVLDGNHRGVGPMALKILDECGLMDDDKFEKLNWFWHPKLKNPAERVYGSYQTEFE